MRVLEGCEPERVLYYFEEIAAIPHGSKNTKAISDHLVSFAVSHGLSSGCAWKCGNPEACVCCGRR